MCSEENIMKTRKQGLALLAAIAGLSLSLAGCGGGGGGGRQSTRHDDPVLEGELEYDEDGKIEFDNVEVTMMSIIGEPDLTIHKKLIEKFNSDYAGRIYIKLVSAAHAEYYPNLETLWKNDFEAFPDVCFMHNEKTATYANKGYLYSLSDATLKSLGCTLDFSQVYENIDRVTIFDNNRYAVPVDAHGFITNFRTDIILKNGLGFENNTRAIPQSRTEYLSLLKKLKDKAAAGELLIRNITKGQDHAWKLAPTSWQPSCYQSTDPDGLSALYANDGTMTSADGRTITFQNNAGFKTYITDQIDNWTKGYYTDGTNTEYFPAGNVAMFNEGPWWASMSYDPMYNNSDLKTVNEKLHVSEEDVEKYSTPYVPMHPDGWWSLDETSANAHKWYGNGHIMALTKHITDVNVAAAAVEFMNWYIGAKTEYKIGGENQDAYNLAYWCSSGHIPAWKNVYASDEYKHYLSTNVTLQALGNPENIIAMESHPYETVVFNAVANCVESVHTLMRAGTCTLAKAEEEIAKIVASAQTSLDMLYDAEDF